MERRLADEVGEVGEGRYGVCCRELVGGELGTELEWARLQCWARLRRWTVGCLGARGAVRDCGARVAGDAVFLEQTDRVGEIKMASPVSLRLREGFVRYSRLDLSGGGCWDVDGMRPRLEGERRW